MTSFNRTCDQLREEAHEQSILQEIAFRLDVTPVNIDAITQCLEDVKRDADRQQYIHRRNSYSDAKQVHKSRQIVCCKLIVFEEEQYQQIENDARDKEMKSIFLTPPQSGER